MVNEVHMKRGANMLIHDILHRMRHDGCGGRPEKAELLIGIEGASSRPVRSIVLIQGAGRWCVLRPAVAVCSETPGGRGQVPWVYHTPRGPTFPFRVRRE